MADISINKFRTAITRGGATPATPGFAETEGQDPVNPSGSGTQYGVGAGLSLDSTNRIQLGNGDDLIYYKDPEARGIEYYPSLSVVGQNSSTNAILQVSSSYLSSNQTFYTDALLSAESILQDSTFVIPKLQAYSSISDADDVLDAFVQLNYSKGLLSSKVAIQENILTGFKMFVTDEIASKGLENSGDYEANFTARSLVTKQYVDGAVSGAAITIGSPANGLSLAGTVLSLGLASAGVTGALSGTDWSTFNGKLNLTSPITGYTVGANTALADTDTILGAFGKIQGQINARVSGTIASGQVAFGTGINTVGGDSGLTWDNTNKFLTITRTSAGSLVHTLRLLNLSNTVNTETSIQFGPSASGTIRYAEISAFNDGSNNIGLKFIRTRCFNNGKMENNSSR